VRYADPANGKSPTKSFQLSIVDYANITVQPTEAHKQIVIPNTENKSSRSQK